jgi:hypothetical protein
VKAMASPCVNCPWRLDVAPGEFQTERYRVLAASAEDMSQVIFQCHKTGDVEPVACAGFLSQSAAHNLAVRLAYCYGKLEPKDRSGGLELHPHYTSLAVANGVAADDPALARVRNDQ